MEQAFGEMAQLPVAEERATSIQCNRTAASRADYQKYHCISSRMRICLPQEFSFQSWDQGAEMYQKWKTNEFSAEAEIEGRNFSTVARIIPDDDLISGIQLCGVTISSATWQLRQYSQKILRTWSASLRVGGTTRKLCVALEWSHKSFLTRFSCRSEVRQPAGSKREMEMKIFDTFDWNPSPSTNSIKLLRVVIHWNVIVDNNDDRRVWAWWLMKEAIWDVSFASSPTLSSIDWRSKMMRAESATHWS